MAGKIFFRERTHVGEGEQMPRFLVVAIAGVDLKIHAKHLRKSELAQIAEAIGAELVELSVAEKAHKVPMEE